MSSSLRDRVVIITGAGAGIGRASALRCAAAGAVVIAVDIVTEAAAETAALVQAAGGRAEAETVDVADAAAVGAMIDAVAARHGRIDALFSNAGGQQPRPTEGLAPEDFDRILAVNLGSMFYGIHAVLPIMLAQGGGTLLSTASGAGMGAVPGLAAYGAAKAGMISLTRSIAVEFGARGVRANIISPGSMDTAGLSTWLETLPGGRADYEAQLPTGRLGTPEEIASVAAFLLSDDASYVNGALIPVDGAVHARLGIPRT